MKERVVSAILMLPLLAVLWLGNLTLLAAVVILSLLGMNELYRGFQNMGLKPAMGLGYASYAAWIAILFAANISDKPQEIFLFVMPWLFLSVAAAASHAVFSKSKDVFSGPLGLFGALYIGFFLSHISMTEALPYGDRLVWLIVVTAFLTDIFAYFTGSFFGKTSLAPKISPHKTVEGSIGGILGSTVASAIFGKIVLPAYFTHCVIMGAAGSIFAQLGDLTTSALKRKMGIKDFSNLIPGHGGIMDRFDSMCFVAPFVYYYAFCLMR